MPDSKVPRQDPDGPHIGPMNFAICVYIQYIW